MKAKMIKKTPNPFFFLNTRVGHTFDVILDLGTHINIKVKGFSDVFQVPKDCFEIQ